MQTDFNLNEALASLNLNEIERFYSTVPGAQSNVISDGYYRYYFVQNVEFQGKFSSFLKI